MQRSKFTAAVNEFVADFSLTIWEAAIFLNLVSEGVLSLRFLLFFETESFFEAHLRSASVIIYDVPPIPIKKEDAR